MVSPQSGGDNPIFSFSNRTFNGTSDFVDTEIQLLLNDDAFSLFVDFTNITKATNATILHCMNEAKPWPGFNLVELNTSFFRHSYYSSGTISSNFAANDTNRHKYIVTHEAGTQRLATWYFDNTVGSNTFGGDVAYTPISQTLLVGCYQTTGGTKGRFWNGTIHDFRLWNRVLTQAEIAQIMNDT